MSFFKKIVISTEMSSKMEVIVPEHPADNSAADLRGILFIPMCLTWETWGHQWLKEQWQIKVNIDFLEVIVFCCKNIRTINWAIILSHKFQSWTSLFLSIKPCCCFFSVNSQALPGTSLSLIIWRLIAYPYLALCSWFNDVSSIQPSKLPFPPLNFDSIGLSNFPVNAWNVFLHTFFSGKLHRGIMRMR